MEKLKKNLTQFNIIIMPFLFTIFCGLISYSLLRMDIRVDAKADKIVLDATCNDIDNRIDNVNALVSAKASNKELLRVIQNLEQKDYYLEKANDIQDKRIEKQADVQAQQLDVLQEIKIEIVKLNSENNIRCK